MATTPGDKKADFIDWLKREKPEKETMVMISDLKMLEMALRKNRVIGGHLLEIEDPDVIIGLIENIKAGKGVQLHSRGKAVHNLYAVRTAKVLADILEKK